LKKLIDSAAGYDTGRHELLETIVTMGRPISRRSCGRSRRCGSEPPAAWRTRFA
jgi:hypothetical protein